MTARECVSCRDELTASDKRVGRVGCVVGVICDDCAYWCDGNLIDAAGQVSA